MTQPSPADVERAVTRLRAECYRWLGPAKDVNMDWESPEVFEVLDLLLDAREALAEYPPLAPEASSSAHYFDDRLDATLVAWAEGLEAP